MTEERSRHGGQTTRGFPRRGSVTSARLPLLGLAILLLASCEPPPPAPVADLVVRGGVIHTMDDQRSIAQAVAVANGTIVFVGQDRDVSKYIASDTRVITLGGEMVLPGFHDSHVHLVSGGVELGQCDLNGLETVEAVLGKVTACAAADPEGDWIVGGGWDLPLFPDGNPNRSALDAILPDRPVYLESADAHSVWVNSRALEIAGVTRRTRDPRNGRIERDPKTREPSGTLREDAKNLVSSHLPKLTPEEQVEGLKRGLAMANRFGITSAIEANATDERLEAYEALQSAGGLSARVRVSMNIDPHRDASQVDELVKKRARVGSSPLLRADAAKIFADGVIEAKTAALLEPYVGGQARDRGQLEIPPRTLNAIVARLHAEDFQVHFHSIGDRAIRASLDAIQYAQDRHERRDLRHQIAHVELFDPSDIPRFAALGVVADFQPLWAYADTYITDLTEPVLGPERSRWLYPIKSVLDSGAVVAAGSDWSVSSMNPLDAIQVAVTRLPLSGEGEPWLPEERVSLDAMLVAYTRAGAYVQHREALTGSIEVGKLADLIVLDRDLYETPASEIHEVVVQLTLLGGREVFRAEGFTR